MSRRSLAASVLTNPRAERVASVRSLHQRAARARAGLFLVEGPQGVREAVVHRPDVIRDLYVTASAATRYADVIDRARAGGVRIHEASDEVVAAMGDATTPQGLLAVCRTVTHTVDEVVTGARLVVVLASVRDPGNAGTVLRGADAAGADAVILTEGSVDVHNPKVVRSSAGSLFHLPVVTAAPLLMTLEALKAAGLVVIAADGAGPLDLYAGPTQELLAGPHAWVMGNEAWGLPADIRGACDAVVRVPIRGQAESLNLAMAATVCLFASAQVQT